HVLHNSGGLWSKHLHPKVEDVQCRFEVGETNRAVSLVGELHTDRCLVQVCEFGSFPGTVLSRDDRREHHTNGVPSTPVKVLLGVPVHQSPEDRLCLNKTKRCGY